MHSKGCHFDWSEAKWRNLVDWDFSTSLHCARNDKILGIDNLYPKFRCFAIRVEKIDQKKQDSGLKCWILNAECWVSNGLSKIAREIENERSVKILGCLSEASS